MKSRNQVFGQTLKLRYERRKWNKSSWKNLFPILRSFQRRRRRMVEKTKKPKGRGRSPRTYIYIINPSSFFLKWTVLDGPELIMGLLWVSLGRSFFLSAFMFERHVVLCFKWSQNLDETASVYRPEVCRG